MPRTPPDRWGELFNFAGGGLVHMELFPSDAMLRWRTELDDAGIQALEGSSVDILPAPSAGSVSYPLFLAVNAEIVTPYTNINAYCWMGSFCRTAGTNGEWFNYLSNDATFSLDQVTAVLTNAKSFFMHTLLGRYVANAALETWQRPPMTITSTVSPTNTASPYAWYFDNNGSGALTGGGAGNKMTFDCFYVTMPNP